MELFIVYLVAILVIVPILIIGGVVGVRMRSVFKKHASHMHSQDALNVSVKLLQNAKIEDVAIVEINSETTNCYNAKHRVIKLSSNVIRSNSVTACGVSSFAVGEAALEHKRPQAIRLKQTLHLVASFISKCFVPILLVGTIITFFIGLKTLGNIVCWIITALYLISLIVELFLLILDTKIEKETLMFVEDLTDFSRDNQKNIKRVIHFCKYNCIVDFADDIIYFLKIFFIAFKDTNTTKKSA